MRPTYEQLEEVANLALGALQWCSGSQDFAPEGQARIGWEKLCQPLIGRLNKYFCDLPASSEDTASVDWAVDELAKASEWSGIDDKTLTTGSTDSPISVSLDSKKARFDILRDVGAFSISIEQLERMVNIAKARRQAPAGAGSLVLEYEPVPDNGNLPVTIVGDFDPDTADDDSDGACAKTIIGEVIGDNQSMMARLRVVEHPGSIFASLQIGSLGGNSVYLSHSELVDLYDFLDEHRVLLEEDEELEDLPPDTENYEVYEGEEDVDTHEPRPTVSDGHEPTFEELAALCGRLWPYCVIEIHNIDLNTASVGLRIPHKLTDAHYWATAQDTLNHTLASAIDAATEGEREHDVGPV